jgi:hypothetical protein
LEVGGLALLSTFLLCGVRRCIGGNAWIEEVTKKSCDSECAAVALELILWSIFCHLAAFLVLCFDSEESLWRGAWQVDGGEVVDA